MAQLTSPPSESGLTEASHQYSIMCLYPVGEPQGPWGSQKYKMIIVYCNFKPVFSCKLSTLGHQQQCPGLSSLLQQGVEAWQGAAWKAWLKNHKKKPSKQPGWLTKTAINSNGPDGESDPWKIMSIDNICHWLVFRFCMWLFSFNSSCKFKWAQWVFSKHSLNTYRCKRSRILPTYWTALSAT